VPFEVDLGSVSGEARATFQVPRGAAPRLAKRPVAAKGSYFELATEAPAVPGRLAQVRRPSVPKEELLAQDAEGGGEGGACLRSEPKDEVFATFFSPKPKDTALAIAQILAARLLEWASLLFTPESEAAFCAAEPLEVVSEGGSSKNPASLVVWIGDGSKEEQKSVKEWKPPSGSKVVFLSWSEHAMAKALNELDLQSTGMIDGSWYAKQPADFANADYNLLQDVELIARSMVEAISRKLSEINLDWDALVLAGFGKGGGIALHALVTKLLPKPIAGTILFSPVVVFPCFWRGGKQKQGQEDQAKLFTFWGSKNPSTPDGYCNTLTQKFESSQELQYTPETIPDGEHVFDKKSIAALTKAISLCI
jgi:predicted esterase